MELLFLGTGTSSGVPMIGCHCPVCTSADEHDRRSRPSVVLSYGPTRVLIDAAPELRLQCVRSGVDMIDAVVFTHAHADHIMGLDDLRRFNILRKGPLDTWADAQTHAFLARCFGYAFAPVDPKLKVSRPYLIPKTIDGPFSIGGMTWTPFPLHHGDVIVQGLRVGNFAYCTDVNEIPVKSMAYLNNLDVLVLDALQIKPHPTHLSLDQAVALAQRIGAKQTFFTHIAHAIAHEATNAALPANIRLAYDGQRVAIPPAPNGPGSPRSE